MQLPLHVAWSGQTAFNLDLPKPRMHLYRIVLAEGQLADVTTYLNHDLHRRLLQDVLEIGNSLPLVITGGYTCASSAWTRARLA